jgi:stage II sporulation protein D
VSGATLRARFGLFDTWAYFTAIKARVAPVPPPPTTAPSTGGTGAVTAGVRPVASIAGTVLPAKRGALVTVQRLAGGRWASVTFAIVGRGGRYRAAVTAGGTYRVRYNGDAGPAVHIR